MFGAALGKHEGPPLRDVLRLVPAPPPILKGWGGFYVASQPEYAPELPAVKNVRRA